MGIRRSKIEYFHINNNINSVKKVVVSALNSGGFSSIKENDVINEIRADYKKITVWGWITIALVEVYNGVDMRVEVTANVDNIYALFSSPIKRILNVFKDNLQSSLVRY